MHHLKNHPAIMPAILLSKTICLLALLCLLPGMVMAAETSDKDRGAPDIAGKTGYEFTTVKYIILSCDTNPDAQTEKDSADEADDMARQAAQTQTVEPGPDFDANARLDLPLLPRVASRLFTPIDCRYSAELGRHIADLNERTVSPVISTNDIHADSQSEIDDRHFPATEETLRIKGRSLERYFAKHVEPRPITEFLASCPYRAIAKIPKIPAERAKWADPAASVVSMELLKRSITVKREEIKKRNAAPRIVEFLASCPYSELLDVPVSRVPWQEPIASLSPDMHRRPVEKTPLAKDVTAPKKPENSVIAKTDRQPALKPAKKEPEPAPQASKDKNVYKEEAKPSIAKTEPIAPVQEEKDKVALKVTAPEIAKITPEPLPKAFQEKDRVALKVTEPEIAKIAPEPLPKAFQEKDRAAEKTTVDKGPAEFSKKTVVTEPKIREKETTIAQKKANSAATMQAQTAPSKEALTVAMEAPKKTINTGEIKLSPEMVVASGTTLAPKTQGPTAAKQKASKAATLGTPDKRIELAKLAPPDRIEPARPELPGITPPATQFPSDYAPPDITRGGTNDKRVAFTFDGGSDDNEATSILETLRERGIKATIFLTGEFIQKYPDVVRYIVAQGHEVGNHTMTHPHLTTFEKNFRHNTIRGVTRETLRAELRAAADAFKRVTGTEMAPLWRAPYGEVNEDLRRWAYAEGYMHVGWTTDRKARQSLDTLDWVADTSSRLYRSAKEIKRRLLDFGSDGDGINGGIVLMHLGTQRLNDRASEMLGDVIDELTFQGYQIVKVSSLIRGNPALDAALKRHRERILAGVVMAEDNSPRVRP